MVKKYNLSVPDDLAAQIEDKRDYLGNLSAIFQEAVAGKIHQKQEFESRLKGDEQMDAVIERLRKEKLETQTDYFEKGRNAGLEWAKAAPYRDLEYARKFDPLDEEGLYDPRITLHDKVLGDYFLDSLESDPFANPEYDEDELNPIAVKWLKGWMEAVNEFCRKIVDKL
jgi:hypothetical protein